MQAKGRRYSVQSLLAGSDEEADRYAKGCFATTYLSPRDYHRVHMPIRGYLVKTRYIPGDLFSVNAATVERVDGLLARNERLICFFETERGGVAVVLVGAMIVAGIATCGVGEKRRVVKYASRCGQRMKRRYWRRARNWVAFFSAPPSYW